MGERVAADGSVPPWPGMPAQRRGLFAERACVGGSDLHLVPLARSCARAQVCNPDELLHFLSNYLTELSLLDHIMMNFLPSQIAAAAVYLANLMLRRPGWDGTLQHYSTYGVHDFLACTRALAQLHQAVSTNTQLAAIREKYASPRFQSVSRVPISHTLMQQLGA